MEPLKIRPGRATDYFQILDLYSRVYSGNYSEETVTNPETFRNSFASETLLWMVGEKEGRIVGSMNFTVDPQNGLTKVSGGVVDPNFQGQGIAEGIFKKGIDEIRRMYPTNDIFFGLIRTVSTAPQRLTTHMNFKTLGVFPNAHRTHQFETNCVTALVYPEALRARNTDFLLHPALKPIYDIVAREHKLPDLKVDTAEFIKTHKAPRIETISFEAIEAPQFIEKRYLQKKESWGGHHLYSSFHKPNLLLISTDQEIEVFGHYAPKDQSFMIMAVMGYEKCGLDAALRSVRDTLRDRGIRYIEIGMRARETQALQMAMQAGFIPSAYFPALERVGEQRHDFAFLSLTFEALSFRNLKFEGSAQEFVKYYVQLWKQRNLEGGM